MQKVKKNKYTVYGINNVTSLLQSKKYDIDKNDLLFLHLYHDNKSYLYY